MENRIKYWNYLYLLISFFFIALIVVFPVLPIKFNLFGWNVDTTLEGPNINLQLGEKLITKDLDPVYGLEFGGGYRLILDINLDDIEEEQKEFRIQEVVSELKNRAYKVGLSDFQLNPSISKDSYQITFDIGYNEDFQKSFLIATTGQISIKRLSEENKGTEDSNILYDPTSYVDTEITIDDFEKAIVTTNTSTGDPAIQIVFTDEGLEKFATVAKNNVGNPVAIMIDDSIISAPTISEDFVSGSISNPVISGSFDNDYAQSLVSLINSGALSSTIELSSTEVINPYWDADVVNNSLIYLGIGFLLVNIYLFFRYRKQSFIFFFSTIFNFVVSIAFMEFGFPTIISWLFSGILGDLIFEPMVITTASLWGLFLSNLIFIRVHIVLFELFKDTKKINSEFIKLNFNKALEQTNSVWKFVLILCFIFGWFGIGTLSTLATSLGLCSLICIFTFNTLTRTLTYLFNKEK